MRRSIASSLAFAVALGTAAWLGHQLSQSGQAATKRAEAEALLAAPIEQSPGLGDLRATEARKLLQEASQLKPSAELSGLIELTRALEAWQHDKLDACRAALVRGRKLAPQAKLLQLTEASLALRTHDLAAAKRDLTPLLASAGSDPRVLLLAADVAREQGAGEDALGFVTRALKAHPQASVLHERLGRAHELLGDQADAQDDYQAAARLDAHAVTPLLHLGRLQRERGELRQAILTFRRAADRNPNDAETWLGSGVCRREIGDLQGARADFEQAQLLDLMWSQPLLALGDLDAQEHELASAARRYLAATKLSPDDPAAWVKLGNMLVRQGKAMDAVSAFRKAIALANDLAQAHNGLGAALLALGEDRAATTELAAAATLDLHDPNPLLNLGMLRKKAGDQAGAQAAFAQAKARAPEIEIASLMVPVGRTASAARRP